MVSAEFEEKVCLESHQQTQIGSIVLQVSIIQY